MTIRWGAREYHLATGNGKRWEKVRKGRNTLPRARNKKTGILFFNLRYWHKKLTFAPCCSSTQHRIICLIIVHWTQVDHQLIITEVSNKITLKQICSKHFFLFSSRTQTTDKQNYWSLPQIPSSSSPAETLFPKICIVSPRLLRARCPCIMLEWYNLYHFRGKGGNQWDLVGSIIHSQGLDKMCD